MISKTDILLLRAKLQAFFLRTRGLFTSFIEILNTTENWWAVLAVYFGATENAYVRFRGTSIFFYVTKDNWTNYISLKKVHLSKKIRHLANNRFGFSHPRGLEFDCYDNALDFFGYSSEMDCYKNDLSNVVCEVAGLKFIAPFPFGTYELREIFIDKIYGEPCCNNAVIVDVGAFIGDSPLFFARRGAKLVVVFEPIPFLFNILNENVVLNGFEKVIETRNEAIGSAFGIIEIGYDPTWPGVSSKSRARSGRCLTLKVPSVPLSEVITELGWVDILKMDCEGCEHEALKHAGRNGALKRVGMIIMEVHSEVRSLIELLKSEGFKITKLIQISKNRWILSAQRAHRNTTISVKI